VPKIKVDSQGRKLGDQYERKLCKRSKQMGGQGSTIQVVRKENRECTKRVLDRENVLTRGSDPRLQNYASGARRSVSHGKGYLGCNRNNHVRTVPKKKERKRRN